MTGVLLGASVLVSVAGVAWTVGGAGGILYLALWVLATLPGWPLGFIAFGRTHAAGWVAGALAGYGLTCLGLAAAIHGGVHGPAGFTLVWLALNGLTWPLLRLRLGPVLALPPWTRRDTRALCLALLLVPVLTGITFRHVGATDPDGTRNYRAYFTADFVWHVALTGELSRFSLPPTNPYLAEQPLHYYWTYFVTPAAALGAAPRHWGLEIEPTLLVNAVGAGVLFVGMLFVVTWSAVPRAGPALLAVLLAVLASSAEGAWVLWGLWRDGRPLAAVRELNIDAITMWFFQGLTIDGLQRSLWYVPQHAGACAFGLIALVVANRADARTSVASAAVAGTALGLAVAFSPFLGGVMSLVYGLSLVLGRLTRPAALGRTVAVQGVAVALAGLGVLWCVANGMIEGAGGAVHVGFIGLARHAPVVTLLLALGPLLALAVPGLALAASRRAAWTGIAGLLLGLTAFYLVSLPGRDPVWVGWRAGQILLVTTPALAALTIAWLADRRRGRWLAGGLLSLLFLVGLPTLVIDTYNAQDVGNRIMGPGFRWTVSISPAQQEAFRWIQSATPRDAVVQPDSLARDRETWTLLPTFGQRRMAAGLPISLLFIDEYRLRSEGVHRMFSTPSADEAFAIARSYRIDYIWVGDVERQAVPAAGLAKFAHTPEYFREAFSNAEVTVFAIHRAFEF